MQVWPVVQPRSLQPAGSPAQLHGDRCAARMEHTHDTCAHREGCMLCSDDPAHVLKPWPGMPQGIPVPAVRTLRAAARPLRQQN